MPASDPVPNKGQLQQLDINDLFDGVYTLTLERADGALFIGESVRVTSTEIHRSVNIASVYDPLNGETRHGWEIVLVSRTGETDQEEEAEAMRDSGDSILLEGLDAPDDAIPPYDPLLRGLQR